MSPKTPKVCAKELDYAFLGSKAEAADTRSLASRQRLRNKMNADVEAFLAQGGEIQAIAPNVQSDPPTRPITSYGSRPI